MAFYSIFHTIYCVFLQLLTKAKIVLQLFSCIEDKLQFNISINANLWKEEEDSYDMLQTKSIKLFDKYSKDDIEKMIKISISQEQLVKLGLDDWYVELDLSDPITHSFYVRSRKFSSDPSKFIAYMAAQYKKMEGPYNVLNVKWFALQNPNGVFTEKRPRLPGQVFPGTGLGRQCVKIMYKMASSAGRDGVINFPEHFHNAYMYDFCYFVDAHMEGWFRRMKEDLRNDIKTKGLAMVSWAIYLGCLREKGQPTKWEMKEQAMPISVRYFLHFFSPKYRLAMLKAKGEAGPFTIDWEQSDKFFKKNLIFQENTK